MQGYGSKFGKMNLDDFLELMQQQIRANTSDRNADSLPAATIAFFADAFRLFDKDQDGYLNMNEVKKALQKVLWLPLTLTRTTSSTLTNSSK